MRIEELMNKVNNKSEEHKQRAYIEDRIAEIVNILIKKRLELKMTQKDLANKIGMKQEAIARFETIKVIPKIDTILKIAYGLNLNLKIFDANMVDDVMESISTLTNKLDKINNAMNEIKYSLNEVTYPIKGENNSYSPNVLGSSVPTVIC